MRLVLVVLVLLAGCSMTVKGIVRDKVTGSPIAGAVVQIEGSGQSTTNENGLYTIFVDSSHDPVAVSVVAPEHYPWSDMRTFHKSQGNPLVLNVDLLTQDDVVRKRERFEAGRQGSAPNVTVTTVPTVQSAASAPAEPTRCEACGARVEPDARFCKGCGAKLR